MTINFNTKIEISLKLDTIINFFIKSVFLLNFEKVKTILLLVVNLYDTSIKFSPFFFIKSYLMSKILGNSVQNVKLCIICIYNN